ncbi:hypothetical protein HGA91_03185 [candidate division WWE3 bacterium]|nr:hypothetical protein [candidate division WWE3 bacterium]
MVHAELSSDTSGTANGYGDLVDAALGRDLIFIPAGWSLRELVSELDNFEWLQLMAEDADVEEEEPMALQLARDSWDPIYDPYYFDDSDFIDFDDDESWDDQWDPFDQDLFDEQMYLLNGPDLPCADLDYLDGRFFRPGRVSVELHNRHHRIREIVVNDWRAIKRSTRRRERHQAKLALNQAVVGREDALRHYAPTSGRILAHLDFGFRI